MRHSLEETFPKCYISLKKDISGRNIPKKRQSLEETFPRQDTPRKDTLSNRHFLVETFLRKDIT
jgi:hypothetical protein